MVYVLIEDKDQAIEAAKEYDGIIMDSGLECFLHDEAEFRVAEFGTQMDNYVEEQHDLYVSQLYDALIDGSDNILNYDKMDEYLEQIIDQAAAFEDDTDQEMGDK